MNEKIKEIAIFDGFKAPPKGCTNPVWHNKERNHVVRDEDLHSYYLTNLNTLHRVALDVVYKIKATSDDKYAHEATFFVHNAFCYRPDENGQYATLGDAIYDAIVYLKQHKSCCMK